MLSDAFEFVRWLHSDWVGALIFWGWFLGMLGSLAVVASIVFLLL